ncbi:hypothetical protein F53441_9080 [Fusarium austroafricanum]|uniref:Uncharacterized protein n=1 Tax=Fusarium austroafricanum TaxID=2364996 RepID=A0A8H4KBI3_9HYPO|nr:hypothetical protein F53441_9080 [Fusarium austroafricanum]
MESFLGLDLTRNYSFFTHKQFLLRAKATTENGLETIGLYAAGIAAANFAGVPTPTINTLGLGYVVSRLAYNVAYLWLQTDPRFGRLRAAEIKSLIMFQINYIVIFFASTAFSLLDGPGACDTDPAAITAAPEAFDCDYSYCDENSVSWCFHFIPFTTIDPALGPLPGETRVSVGTCGPKTV